jgi:hypothetical protein
VRPQRSLREALALNTRMRRGAVTAVALHPDGRTLFTGAADGAVAAWSLPGAAPLRVLRGHTAAVCALALQGARLYSASRDGSVRAWCAATGACHAVLRPYSAGGACPAAVALALAGDTLAASFADGAVHLWRSAPPHAAAGALRCCGAGVTGALALTHDGALLLSGGADGAVRAWPVAPDAHGRRLCCGTLGEHTAAVTALALVPGGARLFSACADGELRAYSLSRDAAGALRTDGACLAAWRPHAGGRVRGIAAGVARPGAFVLFSASEDGAARAWLPPPAHAGGEALAPRAADWLTCVACCDAAVLAVGAANGAVTLWRVAGLLLHAARVPHRGGGAAATPAGAVAPSLPLALADEDLFPVPLRNERAQARDAALRAADALRARVAAMARQEASAAAVAARIDPDAAQHAAAPGWRGGYGLGAQHAALARLYGAPAAAAQAEAAASARRGAPPLSALLAQMDAAQPRSAADAPPRY